MRTPRARRGARPRPGRSCAIALGVVFAVGVAALLIASWATSSRGTGLGPAAASLPWEEALAFRIYLSAREPDLQAPSRPSGAVRFEVLAGDSAAQVADRLHSQGRLEDPLLFRVYLHYTGGDRQLVPGTYLLPAGASARTLADDLAHGQGRLRPLTVLAGLRAEEISSALTAADLPILPGDFLSALQRRPGNLSLYLDLPPQAGLAGFLFPDSYLVDPKANADLVVYQMVEEFDAQVDPSLRSGFEQQGLSLYQAAVLASLVQREVIVPSEMPVVASVFLNRLARGMPLQSDVTVQYAIGYVAAQNTWWKNPLSSQDLETPSPFNTYLHTGLPPAPIDNPGLAALQAVARPAQTNYLYFRAACDGSGRHVFSENYAQQLAAGCH